MNALKNRADKVAEWTGGVFRTSVENIGSLALFFIRLSREKWHKGMIVEQMYVTGVKSLSFVAMSSVFVGFITIMTYTNLTARLNVEPFIMGMMVSRLVFMELGPTLVGLILAGKIGAKIASEISFMRIAEQIDALTCLSLNPMRYLINSRVVACLLMGPVFFATSSLIAILSSQIFASLTCGVSAADFYSGMKNSFQLTIAVMGIVKVTSFSVTNAIVGCYYGFYASGGALGIGKATRNTVVASSLLILLENIILTTLLL